MAKEIVSIRLEAQQGKSYPGLAYVDDSVVMTPEARKYLANTGYAGVTKVAIVISSKIKAVMANIFVKIDQPLKPTKVFTNSEEAKLWLKKDY